MRTQPDTAAFEWDARDYALHSAAQQAWARELIAGVRLKGHEALLDIGCGDGKVTAEIARHLDGGRVVGIDNSDQMITLAMQRYPAWRYPNLRFVQMDASQLPFREEFDIVFSNACLHWILEHGPVLAGIYRALKPGGRAVVQMGGRGNAQRVVEILDEIIREDPWKGYFKNFTFPYGFYAPQEYGPWLAGAGFSVQRLVLKPRTMAHEDREAFKGWIRTTWLPYLHRVDQRSRTRFIESIAQRYLRKYPPDDDGKIKVPMQRLEFIAARPSAGLRRADAAAGRK